MTSEYMVNLVKSEIILRIRNLIDPVSQKDYYTKTYTYVNFNIFMVSKTFDTENIKELSEPTLTNVSYSGSDLIQLKSKEQNKVVSVILQKNTYSYFTKFGNLEETNIYSIENIKEEYPVIKTIDRVDDILNLRFKLPLVKTFHFNQNHDYILSIGIVGGWTFILSTIAGQLIIKISRIKMKAAICRDSFSLLYPKDKHKIDSLNKDTIEQLSGNYIITSYYYY